MGAYGQLQVFLGGWVWASSADTYILQMYYLTTAVFVKKNSRYDMTKKTKYHSFGFGVYCFQLLKDYNISLVVEHLKPTCSL